MIAFRFLSPVWRQIDLPEMLPYLFSNRPATCFGVLVNTRTSVRHGRYSCGKPDRSEQKIRLGK